MPSFGTAHHVYVGGHAMGKISAGGHIYDKLGHKVGSIERNGTVRDHFGHKVGKIGEHGAVYDKWSSHAQFHTEGKVIRDHHGKVVAQSSGGSLGGAAMLLMLNKDQ